ncbi:MAG: hypothetical protein EXR62_09430 [Chloroflexi bacterium]|nr:hypothetical protein [Chloroflexota bacterium]
MARPPWQPVTLTDYLKGLYGQPNLTLAIGTVLVGLLENVLAAFMGDWEFNGIPGSLIITVVLLILLFALFFFYRWRTPLPVIEMREKAPEGKAGLVLLLSTLSALPRGSPEQVKQRIAAVDQAVAHITTSQPSDLQDGDFAPLVGTNLEPELRALEYHLREDKLRECWIISTKDTKSSMGGVMKGSEAVGELLERWFHHFHPNSGVRFHRQDYVIAPRDYMTLWQKVDGIFRNGDVKPESIICDITGGLKTMSIGVALACMGGNRDMQYMASDRDWRGEPLTKGQMAPILISVNPHLVYNGKSQP